MEQDDDSKKSHPALEFSHSEFKEKAPPGRGDRARPSYPGALLLHPDIAVNL
jgi:hypothetical protein